MKAFVGFRMAWLITFVLISTRGWCDSPPIPKFDEISSLAAKSDLIVTGTLQVPIQEIQQSVSSGMHKYVKIDVTCDRALKGLAPETARVTWFTESRPGAPSPSRIIELDGKRAVLFLTDLRVKDATRPREEIRFAGDTPRALSDADPRLLKKVRQVLSMRGDMLAQFDALFPPAKEPLYAKVKELVDATTRADTQMSAFRDLEALGPKGVPAIVMFLDDPRKLGVPEITLKNPPGHWEGLRHYAPRTVGDALHFILNQITGEDFGGAKGWKLHLFQLRNGEERAVQKGTSRG
jgi:hypothetical protein